MALKPYQRVGVDTIKDADGCMILADEPGLGKTLQVLAAIYERPDWGTVLIVCPSTAKGVWEAETKQWLKQGVTVISSRQNRIIEITTRIVIINYDILADWIGVINSWIKPGLVVFDEGHALVNTATLRYKMVMQLCCKRRLIVTGTPVVNVADDLAVLRTITGSRKVLRRVKGEVLAELPVADRRVIEVEISNRGEYDYAYRNFMSWLASQGNREALTAAAKAEGLVRIGYLKRLVGVGKIEAVQSFLAGLTGKTIVFAIHKKVIAGLANYGSVVIDGSRTAVQRTEAIAAFALPGVDRLVANIVSGGASWNGTMASAAVIAELPWTYAKLEQAEKRIDRIGQTEPPVSYVLLGRGTIEKRFWEIVIEKRDLSDMLLGDTRDTPVAAKTPWWKIW